MTPEEQADADGARESVALFLGGHPYRAIHRVLPILITTTHPSVRRFAWKQVEAMVVRQEQHPLPSPRHLASFLKIWRQYQAEAEAAGDAEVAALLDRAIAGAHLHDWSLGPPRSLSTMWMTMTLEASELQYAASLAGRVLSDHAALADLATFVATTPAAAARDAAQSILDIFDRARRPVTA